MNAIITVQLTIYIHEEGNIFRVTNGLICSKNEPTVIATTQNEKIFTCTSEVLDTTRSYTYENISNYINVEEFTYISCCCYQVNTAKHHFYRTVFTHEEFLELNNICPAPILK